jgi:O-antigen/teichoic acid export membrane protein
VVRYLIQFGTTVVVARYVTPDAFGLLAMILVFTALGSVLVDSGTGTALIQRQRSTADEETTVFVLNVAISMVAALALVLVAPSIAAFYARPELVPMLRTMALVFPLNGLAVVPDALLTQTMRFSLRARVETGSSLVSALVAVLLARLGYGPWALVWQAIASIGSRATMLWIIAGWRPTGRLRWDAARSVWSFGGFILLLGLLDTLATRAQSLVVGKIFPATDLGYYSIAQNTQQAPASFAAAILNRLGLPIFSAVRDDPPAFERTVRTSMIVSEFLFAPLMALLCALATPTVRLVYGATWLPAAPLLAVFTVATVLWPSHVINLAAMNALGRPGLSLRLEMAKKTLAIVLLLVAAPLGVLAVAWATVATSAASFVINTWYAKQLFGYGAVRQAWDLLRTLAPATVSGALGAFVATMYESPLMACIGGGLTGAAAYITLCALTRHPAFRSIAVLIRGPV